MRAFLPTRSQNAYPRPVLLDLQHVTLVVADLERSRRFYVEKLGLVEVPRPASFAFGGAWFAVGAQEIHLIVASESTATAGWEHPGQSAQTGSAPHIAFEVDDLDAEIARLESAGIAIVGGPRNRGDDVIQLYVLDPDDHLVELFARPGAEPRPTSQGE